MLDFLRHVITSKYFFPALSVAIAIPAFRFMLRPGHYYNMQDDMQLIRQMEFESCLKDGQIPCRWTPRLGYGYGYPEFNFYPPLPYIIGQIFRTLKLSYLETVKYGAITQFICAALAMYLLVSSIFGRYGGLLASLFYTYAPYHALNIYVRGAYNEAWASVFFPLLFHFSRIFITKNRYSDLIFLSLSFCGLFLSHNPMALIFAPALFLWSLYWLFATRITGKRLTNVILGLTASGLLGISLSAFFTLPLIFESKYVQLDTMFKNYFDFRAHFVSLYQLFISNFWGDGPSVWQEADGMSFMVGYLHWIIPLFLIFYFLFQLVRYKKPPKNLVLPVGLILFALLYLFMTHQRSTFLWLILKPIQKIQFPWRFLNPALFLLSLSVGIIPQILNKFLLPKIFKLVLIAIMLITLVINFSHFYPVIHGRLSEKEKFSGQAWINQITSGIYDYLPKTAKIAAKTAAKEYVDLVDPPSAIPKITGQKHGTDWLFFNLTLDRQANVYVSQLAFPGFVVKDYGRKIPYKIDPELGRIVLNLDPGDHQLFIKLTNTPIRTIANYLSLISWILVISALFLWKNQPSKSSSKKPPRE